MAYCTGCGTEVDESASFCQECGSEIDATESAGQDEQSEPEPPAPDDGDEESDSPDIDAKRLIAAILVALIPAFGAYMMTGIALYNPYPVVFLLGIAVFGYLLYQRPTVKAMFGGASFWLAVEAFLTPLALLIYTFSFASAETQTGAEQAGAAIGGIVLVVIAFVVCLPLGIVLYLISGRLDVDD